jgi:hypothetical protein
LKAGLVKDTPNLEQGPLELLSFGLIVARIHFPAEHSLPAERRLISPTWNCPQQQCNRMIDFMLVFDESGSIDRNSFNQEKTFAEAIATSYTFSPQHVAMGLVLFDTNARWCLRIFQVNVMIAD